MKNIALILLLALFSICSFAQSKEYVLAAKDKPLSEVFEELEKEYGFLFSFKPTDIEGIRINSKVKASNSTVFFNRLFKDCALKFEITDERYVLISSATLASEPLEQDKDLAKEVFRFCGIVKDKLSDEALPFANVYLPGSSRGASTNESGRFSFEASFSSSDSLQVSYVGFETQRFLAADFLAQPCKSVSLEPVLFDEDMIVVTEYITDGISLAENGASISLQPDRIQALPGQVDADILKTIQFLPGVSSPDGSPESICIRGGSPDQNLILWEDIPLYHAAHYFGMISAINPYIINEANVYRSGFDAAYGGRISGLIDLKSDHSAKDNPSFGVGSNLINAFAYGQTSLFKNKASIVFSVRRSFAELWHSPTFNSITRRIKQGELLQLVKLGKLPDEIRIADNFNFFDANAKATFQLSKKDAISFAGFIGQNDFESEIFDDMAGRRQADSLYLKNHGAKLSWTRYWTNRLTSTLAGVNSDYGYNYDYVVNASNTPDKLGDKYSYINEKQINFTTRLNTISRHQYSMGYQLQHFDVGFEIDRSAEMKEGNITFSKAVSNLHVLHADFKSNSKSNLGAEIGLRYTFFEKENSSYWEPRLKLWYRPSKTLRLLVNAGRYHQFLTQLIEIAGDNSSIDTPVWAFAGEKEVPVLTGTQMQLGAIYNKNDWVVDLQAYVKRIEGISSLASDFDAEVGSRFLIGEANIRGLDLLIKKRWQRWRSWVSYSISKVENSFPKFFDPAFASPIDQPHALHWVNVFDTGPWAFSMGWKINSGVPHSNRNFFRVRENNQGPGPAEIVEPVVESYNSERLDMQHQLDLSCQYTLRPKLAKRWTAVIGFSLFNVYNQKNVYNRDFILERQQSGPSDLRYASKVDMGITPNLVVKVTW